MKVIFLDNDGVICLFNNWGSRAKKWSKYRSANPASSQNLKDAC
jgi:histidinol phosphatase-like enzyme